MREQKNLIRRMSTKVLFLAVTALSMSFPAAAQEGNITLPIRKISAEEVFENIQNQTGYKVAANSRQTAGLTWTPKHATTSVKTVLEHLLDGSGITYRMDGNFIVVYRAPEVNQPTVTLNVLRNIAGSVCDPIGNPLEGVTVALVNLEDKKAVTHSNGRFLIEEIPPGNHIAKITSAAGNNIRYREIVVPTGGDADVKLQFNDELLVNSGTTKTAAETAPAKTTAYFIPNSNDHTIKAFTDDPKTNYSLTPEQHVGSNGYHPRIAVKTNLLYLATTTPNLAVEFGLGKKWTLDIAAGLNPWDLNSHKGGIRHGLIQPELRYWFCQRFEKHFVGLHGMYGQYEIADIDLKPFGNDLTGKRYNGWGAGAGLSYGYHLPMSSRWSWEFTAGLGYIYLDYDKYSCGTCETLIGDRQKHYFGPTKIGVSLIYMIK